MNKQELITKIGVILDRIKSQKNPTEESTKSELQELLNDTEDLVETVSVLKFIINDVQRTPMTPAETPCEEESTEETEQQTPKYVNEANGIEGEQIEEVISEEDNKPIEINEGDICSVTVEEKESAEIVKLKEATGEKTREQTDLFSSEESTLNEKNSQDSLSVATKLEKQKIFDLIGAIGINERFAFINELFDGDADEFNEALKKLNSFADHKEAFTFIDTEIKSKYNWDEESQVVLDFSDLIEKRYVV